MTDKKYTIHRDAPDNIVRKFTANRQQYIDENSHRKMPTKYLDN